MPVNDLFLVITWVVGIGAAVISVVSAKRRVRSAAQLQLDLASFKGAQAVIDLLQEQLEELREELKVMRGEYSTLRARECKLLRRIQRLERLLHANGIELPDEDL